MALERLEVAREALCQRGLSLASSSPVHFSLVKFRGKLDGAAKLDVFPPAAERSADQAHSRGKLSQLALDPRLTSAVSSGPSLHDIPWPPGQICVEVCIVLCMNVHQIDCDSPDVHGLMVSPRPQPPLLRPSHMVQHSQQTPALQDTSPTDQTSWHTDGHTVNTTTHHLDGVMPSAIEKSTCA
ncbi:unnamed protein product [Leuciscus chuanchicus]